MSLGMMMYTQQRFAQRDGDCAPCDDHPSNDRDTRNASAPRVEEARFEKTLQEKTAFENSTLESVGGYTTQRPRSIGLPLMIVITIVALILSFLRPGVANAAAANTFPALCQIDGATIKAHNDETWRIVNDTGSVQRVVCPLADAVSTVVEAAKLIVEQPETTVARTTCSLLSRRATGGQATGERKRVTASGRATLTLPVTKSGVDYFHYVQCDLAPGATLSDIQTIGVERAASAASRNAVNAIDGADSSESQQDWVLLSREPRRATPRRSSRHSILKN